MEKPVVYLATPCDHAIVDKDSKISAIGIFDKFFVEEFSNEVTPFFFVTKVALPEKLKVYKEKIEIIDDKEKVLFTSKEVEIRTDKKSEKIGLVMWFRNIKFEKYGEHFFRVIIDGNELYRQPISVERRNL